MGADAVEWDLARFEESDEVLAGHAEVMGGGLGGEGFVFGKDVDGFSVANFGGAMAAVVNSKVRGEDFLRRPLHGGGR